MSSKEIQIKKPALILCDIEGTTTAITFVHDVLFPYVRQNVHSYLLANWSTTETMEDVALLWRQYLQDKDDSNINDLPQINDFSISYVTDTTGESIEAAVKYILWQMDRDKKTTALKQLQGHIWLDGYQSGKIKAHVYEEVPDKFKEWFSSGIQLGIYSSGSVLAQKLLFRYTTYGDLTKYITHYFDTKIGAKQEVESYTAISEAVKLPAADILFLTDIDKEARAAISAGMECIVLTRGEEGPTQQSAEETTEFKTVNDFKQILFN